MPDNLARPLHSWSNRDFPMPFGALDHTQLPAAGSSRGERPSEPLRLGCALQWLRAAHCRQR